jgi:hypothetical protein
MPQLECTGSVCIGVPGTGQSVEASASRFPAQDQVFPFFSVICFTGNIIYIGPVTTLITNQKLQRMKVCNLFSGLLIITAISLSSCGGGSPSPENESSDNEVKAKEMTPDEMGSAVSEIYVKAIADLTRLLQQNASAGEAVQEIETLKEKYVQELIAYGKMRESLEESERSKMDLAIRLGLNDVYRDQVYTNYTESINQYLDNTGLYNLLSSFNILTQYANFELLKQQEPEEAERLGIN